MTETFSVWDIHGKVGRRKKIYEKQKKHLSLGNNLVK